MSTVPKQQRVIDIHCGWGASPAAPHWNDVNAVRTALSARGIGSAFLTPSLSRRYDLVAGDDALAGAITGGDHSTVDLYGWLVIHPSRPADSNALMRKHLYNTRFVGAALYGDPLTGLPVTLRDSFDVVNSFRRYARPLLIDAPNAEAMANIVQIADSLGSIKVIATGMGGEEWHEAIPMAVAPLNLYLDISGALAPEKITYAYSILHGTRKLLFASGAPQTDPAAVLGMLDDIDLSAEDRDRVLYTNAARLFRVGAVADAPAGPPQLLTVGGSITSDTPPANTSEFFDTLGELGQSGPDPNA